MEKKEKTTLGFEESLESLDQIIKNLESGKLTLEESLKEYEKAMKLIKKSSDILNKAQGKILKISESNSSDELNIEEV